MTQHLKKSPRLTTPHHPDTNSSEEASSQFHKLNKAYLGIVKADKDSAHKDYIVATELRESVFYDYGYSVYTTSGVDHCMQVMLQN